MSLYVYMPFAIGGWGRMASCWFLQFFTAESAKDLYTSSYL